MQPQTPTPLLSNRPTVKINVFAPTRPHAKQREVIDDPNRFKVLRAGRKFRKTSLLISWLFEGALLTGLTCPYVAPNRVQAKNIAWRDHVLRLLDELKAKNVPHKVNESELTVTFPNGGRVQLMGVENKESLRGISNWGRFAGDEVDDWEEDIWPLIIRPNLIPHKAPAIMAGTPKGMGLMYKFSQMKGWKEFHYKSHDNPDLDPEELADLEAEYREQGEDYYAQEILAEYVKPVGLVYKEWPLENYKPFEYDPNLPLHVSFDWGVNDPTSIVWIQPSPEGVRILDYYEASDADIGHFVSVLNSKPYKKPDLYTGDPAGKARNLVTGTSVIEELLKKGISIRSKDGVQIPDQVRKAHTFMSRLFVNSTAVVGVDGDSYGRAEGFRDCLLNYKYPKKAESLVNQENEIPIHNRYSHAMRAFEYWAVNVGDIATSPTQPKYKYERVTTTDDLGFSRRFKKVRDTDSLWN